MRELTLRGLIILFAATLAACPPGNQAPSAPMISGIQSTNTSISGTIGACVDDGLPATPGTCSLTVLVADPGTTGPARGSGAVLLPQSGGSFSVTGLTMGQDYSIVATADDGALTSQSGATASTNSAPSTPSLSNVTTPSAQRIEGEISACTDDGIGLPNGKCDQEIIILQDPGFSVSCQASGSSYVCDLPQDTVPVDQNGMWFIDENILHPGTTYFLYGVSRDGMAASLSAKTTVSTPAKYTAIQRSIFADLGEPPPGNTTEPGLMNGVIAGFRIRPKTATDYAIGGFTQQGMWAGISGKSARHEWIETGVTQGFQGANLHTYFTAYGDIPKDIFVEIAYSGSTPVTGNLEYFKIVQCSQFGTLVDLGCGTAASDKWATCLDTAENGTALGDCIIWTDALVDQRAGESTGVNISHGMADMHIGFEATTSTSSVDTVYVKRIRYRRPQLVWSNISNIPWQRTFLAKEPRPSSIHGTDCCQGLITYQGSTGAECAGPKDFIYFFNSSTPTTTSQCN